MLNSVGAKLPRSFGHPVSSNGEEDEYLEISETIELTLTTDAKVMKKMYTDLEINAWLLMTFQFAK